MTYSKNLIDVGAPVPDMKTSPIFLDMEDERQIIEAEIPEERVCYFNDKSYPHDTYIKSTGTILRCDRGAWVEADTEE